MPSHIYLFHNGNVMAFGKDGKQMPEWQGQWQEVIAKLLQSKWQGRVEIGSWRAGDGQG